MREIKLSTIKKLSEKISSNKKGHCDFKQVKKKLVVEKSDEFSQHTKKYKYKTHS